MRGGMEGTMRAYGWLTLLALLSAGCQAPQPDVAGEVRLASGLNDAIVLRSETRGPVDAPSATAGSLTAEQAVRLALSNDPRIQAALARVRVAQADAQQARLLPNPILNVDMRFPEGGGSAIFEATLTGDLISVLQKPRQIKAADKRLSAACAEAVTTVLDVIAEVQESYASAQAADAQIAILEQRQVIIQRLRDVAQNRLEAGEGTRLDVLTLDAQRVRLLVEASDLHLTRKQERLAVARLIGDARGSADWSLDAWRAPPAIRAAESEWVDAALIKRPEIRARAWELSALGDDVALAALAPLAGNDTGAHAEHDQTWVVGPTVTTPIPIFDFGQAARAKAVAERLAARHELAQERLKVIEDVRLAYATYAASREALQRAQEELLPLQEKQREQAELAYRSGEADLATLLLAETDLRETRSTLVDLQKKVTAATIGLQRAAGGAGVASTIEAGAGPTTAPAAITSTEPVSGNNTGSSR